MREDKNGKGVKNQKKMTCRRKKLTE